MRPVRLAVFSVAMLAVLPVFGDDLTFTLDSTNGAGYAPNHLLDGSPLCPEEPGCILFTGVLTDTDSDGSYIFTGPQTELGITNVNLNDIAVTWSTSPTSGGLTVDNTWDDYAGAGVLIGDPNAATDGAGVPNSYSGALFGIDIAPNTTVGEYTGTVTIEAQRFVADANGNFDPEGSTFTVSQQFTVDVTPEPGAVSLALIGLALLGVHYGLRRKWRSAEASR